MDDFIQLPTKIDFRKPGQRAPWDKPPKMSGAQREAFMRLANSHYPYPGHENQMRGMQQIAQQSAFGSPYYCLGQALDKTFLFR